MLSRTTLGTTLRRSTIGIISLAVMATALIQATPARAFPGGSFLVVCDFVKFKRIDPIMDPGMYPTEHLHMFFGNKGISKDSTYSKLDPGSHDVLDLGRPDRLLGAGRLQERTDPEALPGNRLLRGRFPRP